MLAATKKQKSKSGWLRSPATANQAPTLRLSQPNGLRQPTKEDIAKPTESCSPSCSRTPRRGYGPVRGYSNPPGQVIVQP